MIVLETLLVRPVRGLEPSFSLKSNEVARKE
jgi:hypothetical protein